VLDVGDQADRWDHAAVAALPLAGHDVLEERAPQRGLAGVVVDLAALVVPHVQRRADQSLTPRIAATSDEPMPLLPGGQPVLAARRPRRGSAPRWG
jgi:hypothetical protein